MTDELYCYPWTGELVSAEEGVARWGEFFKRKEREMENSFADGGILGLDHDHDKIRREQEAYKMAGGALEPEADAIFALLDEAVTKAEASARDTELQSRYDKIDQLVTKHLKPELEIEFEKSEPTAADKRRFTEFSDYCREHGYKPLPSDPQPVLSYLINIEVPHGAAHVIRARRSIARIHRALNYADPTDDLAVKALVRKITNKHQPETEETNGNL